MAEINNSLTNEAPQNNGISVINEFSYPDINTLQFFNDFFTANQSPTGQVNIGLKDLFIQVEELPTEGIQIQKIYVLPDGSWNYNFEGNWYSVSNGTQNLAQVLAIGGREIKTIASSESLVATDKNKYIVLDGTDIEITLTDIFEDGDEIIIDNSRQEESNQILFNDEEIQVSTFGSPILIPAGYVAHIVKFAPTVYLISFKVSGVGGSQNIQQTLNNGSDATFVGVANPDATLNIDLAFNTIDGLQSTQSISTPNSYAVTGVTQGVSLNRVDFNGTIGADDISIISDKSTSIIGDFDLADNTFQPHSGINKRRNEIESTYEIRQPLPPTDVATYIKIEMPVKTVTGNYRVATQEEIPSISGLATETYVDDGLALKADKTQAFKKIVKIINSSTTTSGTTETLLKTIPFLGDEAAFNDILSMNIIFKKQFAIGVVNVYVRASQTNFASSTIIARNQATSTFQIISLVRESFKFITGNLLKGFTFTLNSISDVSTTNQALGSMTIDPTQPWNLYITAQCNHPSDIINIETAQILVK